MLLIPYSWIWFITLAILLTITSIVYYRRFNGPGWVFLLYIISNVLLVEAQFVISVTSLDAIPDPVKYIADLGFTTILFHIIWFILTIRRPQWKPNYYLSTVYIFLFILLSVLWANPLSLEYVLFNIKYISLALKIVLSLLAIIITVNGIYQQRATKQGRVPIFVLAFITFFMLIISLGLSVTDEPFVTSYQLWIAGYLIANVLYALTVIRHQVVNLKPVIQPLIFAIIPDPIIIVDEQQRVIDANETARKIWGINLEEAGAQSLVEIIPALADPTPPQPLIVSTPANEIFYFEWNKQRIQQDTSSYGTLFFLRNVTQIHQQSQKLQLARQVADEANNAKSLFLANISHELRSPLHAILGFTDLLILDSDLSGQHHRRLEAIRYSGQHLLSVIGDILDMTTIEAGKTQLEPIDYDLHRLLWGVRDMYLLEAQYNHLTLQLIIGGTVPHYVHGDEGKLRQVMVNLVSNAIKFTKQGEICIQANYNDTLQIIITDTGIGIPKEHLEAIFSPFYQLDNGFTGGTGLGLSICKDYIEKMGGNIQVESMIGHGSTFTITLPIDIISVIQSEIPEDTQFNIPNSQHYRVLVVDDRDDDREILCEILHEANFSVRATKSGVDALALVSVWQPHMALIDLDMPEMSGREVAHHLHQHYPNITLIAVTASVYTDVDVLHQDGFHQQFIKPLTTNTILKALKPYLISSTPSDDKMSSNDLINVVNPSHIKLLYERAIVLDIQGTQDVINQIHAEGHLEFARILQNHLDSYYFRGILDSINYQK